MMMENGKPRKRRQLSPKSRSCAARGAQHNHSAPFFCDVHSPWQRGSNENMNHTINKL